MKSSTQNNGEIRPHLRVSVSLAIALGLFASAFGATSPALEPQGVKAQWTFAEGAGTAAGDSSGNNVTGTLMNGATWTVGRIGTAVSLDGANDYVSLGSNLPVLQNVGGATLATWIKLGTLPASGAFREVISISVNSATSPTNMSRAALAVVGDGTTADVFAGGRSTDTEAQQTLTAANANLTANTWHHIAARLDFAGDMIEIYVNGVLSAQAAVNFSAASTPNTTSNNAALGAQDSGDSNYFPGALDETAIYGRLLSATEIQALAGGQELKAHWKMDEGVGGTTADATANAYGGTLKNGLAWTTGQMGSGLSFDGVDDYVDLGSSLSMARNVNATTVTAWIKPGSTIPAGSYRELISLSVNSAGGPTNTSRVALSLKGDGSAGGLYLGSRSTDTEAQKILTVDSNLQTNQWYHVAGVIDFTSGSLTLYLNGLRVATSTVAFSQTHTPNTLSTNAALGAQDTGNSNYFHGEMDDVRIYNRPLCACDIQALVGQNALRAHYKFEEATGATAADSSGNGVTGTLINGPTWATGQIGSALQFDGTNDYVNLGTNLSMLQNVPAATVAGWVKMSSLPASGAYRELVSISVGNPTPTNTSRVALSLVGDGAAADVFVGGRSTDEEAQKNLTADANLTAGTWYHVAATIDFQNNSIKIYKNGSLSASAMVAFSSPLTADTASACAALGSQDMGGSNFFAGLLDDVRIYCRALSVTEIQSLTQLVPPAPTGLTAAAGDRQVSLAWASSSGAISYYVKRSLDLAGPFTSIATTNGTSFVDTGLTNGTTYFYVVSAENVNGESGNSAPVFATPVQLPLPSPPSVLQAVAGDQQVALSWNASVGANSYAVKRSLNTGGPYSVVATVATTALADTGLANGTTYYYVVSALNTSGESGNSNQVSATPTAPGTPPPAPADLTAIAGDGRATLSWNASVGASSYNVKRSQVSQSGYLQVGSTTGINFTDLGLINGTSYFYVVSAVNGSGEGLNSIEALVVPIAPPPPPVITAPVTGAILATNVPTISGGSSSSGLTVRVFVDAIPLATTLSGAGGLWTLSAPSPLAEGTRLLTADASNAAGPSQPSGTITVTIDTVLPTISQLLPTHGSSGDNPRPTISATVSDLDGTGPDLTTVVLTLDGSPVTPIVTLQSAVMAIVSFTPAGNLSLGNHTVQLTAKDRAGNAALPAASTFTIAATLVMLSNASIPADSFVNSTQPAFTATLTNPGGSGINPSSIEVRVDGTVVAATVTVINANSVSIFFTPPAALSQGTHIVLINGLSTAGNPVAPVSHSFGVDLSPPLILNIVPADGSALTSPPPTLSATITDSGGAGIAPGSVLLIINGVQVPASVTLSDVHTASASYSPAIPLTGGSYSLRVEASDRANNAAVPSTANFTITTGTGGNLPVVTITSPAEGSSVATTEVSLAASAVDNSSSIVSIQVLLNGGDITSQITQTPPTPLGSPGTIQLSGTFSASFSVNFLEIIATNAAGSSGTSQVTFRVTGTPPPNVVIALEMVSGNGQTGLTGKAASNSLVVRAYNQVNPTQNLDSVPLSVEIVDGGGFITADQARSIITDPQGLASFKYIFGPIPGANSIQVGVQGHPEVVPVLFTETGQKANLQDVSNQHQSLCNQFFSTSEFPGSALSRLFVMKATKPDGSPLVGETVEPFVLTSDLQQKAPSTGYFIPSRARTDSNGNVTFAFVIHLSAPTGPFVMRFPLPALFEQNGDQVGININGTVRNPADKPRGLADTEINFDDLLRSGQGQIAIPGQRIGVPLRGRFFAPGFPSGGGSIIFSILEGDGIFEPGDEGNSRGFLVDQNCGKIRLAMGCVSAPESGIASVYFTLAPGTTHALIAMEGFTDIFAIGPPEARMVDPNNPSQETRGLVATDPAAPDPARRVLLEMRMPMGTTTPVTASVQSFDLTGTALPASIPGAVAPSTISNIACTPVSADPLGRFVILRSTVQVQTFHRIFASDESVPSVPQGGVQGVESGRFEINYALPGGDFQDTPKEEASIPQEHLFIRIGSAARAAETFQVTVKPVGEAAIPGDGNYNWKLNIAGADKTPGNKDAKKSSIWIKVASNEAENLNATGTKTDPIVLHLAADSANRRKSLIASVQVTGLKTDPTPITMLLNFPVSMLTNSPAPPAFNAAALSGKYGFFGGANAAKFLALTDAAKASFTSAVGPNDIAAGNRLCASTANPPEEGSSPVEFASSGDLTQATLAAANLGVKMNAIGTAILAKGQVFDGADLDALVGHEQFHLEQQVFKNMANPPQDSGVLKLRFDQIYLDLFGTLYNAANFPNAASRRLHRGNLEQSIGLLMSQSVFELEDTLNDLQQGASVAPGAAGTSYFFLRGRAETLAAAHALTAYLIRFGGLPYDQGNGNTVLLQFTPAIDAALRKALTDVHKGIPDYLKTMKGPEVKLSDPEFEKKVPLQKTMFVFKFVP